MADQKQRDERNTPDEATQEEAGIHRTYEATNEEEARSGTRGPSQAEEDRTDVEVEPASKPLK